MKKLFVLFLSAFIFFFFPVISQAESSYVLPYPSVMPGGINYKVHLIWEELLQYWYFGDFGQFTYNLKESDKYVVEAKTLFEYNQYLLGVTALEKSNTYFTQTLPHLQSAKSHGKDIAPYREELHQAALTHIETLQKISNETPAEVTWSPEKATSTTFNLKDLFQKAIQIRQNYL